MPQQPAQTDGSFASDLDFSTTAAVRNMESPTAPAPGEPTTTGMNPSTGAGYPGNMSTGGYGGSESVQDEDTVTDEDSTDTDE